MAIAASAADAIEKPRKQQEDDLHEALRMVDMLGGDEDVYGASAVTALRTRIDGTVAGQSFLLALLHDTRAILTSGRSLSSHRCRRLVDVTGPGSDLASLIDIDNPDTADTQALLTVIDSRIAAAEDRLAAIRRCDDERHILLADSYSLPPDKVADRILRYDAALNSALSRTLSDLQRLQSRRLNPLQNLSK